MINSNNNISGVYINGTFSGDGSGLTNLPGGSGTSGTSGINGANQRINLTSPASNTVSGTFSVNSTDNRLLNLTSTGLIFTPTSTGDVVVSAELGGTIPGGAGYYTIYYGTGSVPANGTTGGSASNTTLYSSVTASYDAISLTGFITGLTVDTEYWFSVAVINVSCSTDTFFLIIASG